MQSSLVLGFCCVLELELMVFLLALHAQIKAGLAALSCG